MSKNFDVIKTSLLRRVIRIPRLAENALNNYGDYANENGGVIEVEIPNGTLETTLFQGSGIFSFGGIGSSSDDISITKVIIDDITVFDSSLSGYVLKTLFATNSNEDISIGGNLTPFLVNKYIRIDGFNNGSTSGPWWRTNSGTLYVSLAPIQ